MVGSTHKRIGVTLAALAGLMTLAGCETRISANATTNAPAQYSHVYITVEQVWVNTSATAGPDDSAWIKQTLDTPQTIDLVGLTSGSLQEFASQLPVPTGTYNQIRLFLTDTEATLTSSAQTKGAQFNNEVDYFDTANVLQKAPLEVPNSATGIALPITLNVKTAEKALLAALGSTSTTGTGTTTNPVCDPTSSLYNPTTCSSSTTNNTTTTTTTTTNTTSDASGLGTVTATAAVVFDAGRDLARFVYSNKVGFALNPRFVGFDLDNVGAIRSQLTITGLAIDGNTSRPDIQVTAETPNSAKTRNVPVLSAPVRSDGTFILYPFPMDDDAPTTYDLVIHGPGIQTLIIKSVPVQSASSTSATSATTVNLGSPTILKAAATYPVNVAGASPVAPRGARVGFYQTINASGELPYLIEERTVDPISGLFAVDQTFPNDNLGFGTYNSGSTITLTTSVPTEGTGSYRLAASAANFGDGDFSGTLTAPASGTTTTTTFTAPTLSVPSPATSGTITATVTISSPGTYDKGAVVVTHDGAIVSVTAIDSLLVPAQASGTLTIGSIPAGASGATLDGGTYYAEVWVWKSTDPTNTFKRQPATALIDLRVTNTANLALTIN